MLLSTATNDLTRRLRGIPRFIWDPQRPVFPVVEMDENGRSEEVNLDYIRSNIYGDWMLHANDTQMALVCSYEQGWEILRIMGARKVGDAPVVFSIFAPISCGENWFCINQTIQTGRLGDCCIIQASQDFFARAEGLVKWEQFEVRDIVTPYLGSDKLYLNVLRGEKHVPAGLPREQLERDWWQEIYPNRTILRTGWYRESDGSIWLPCCCTVHGEIFELVKLAFEPIPNPFRREEPRDYSAQYRSLL